jgi:hypothetical protein
MRDEWIDREIRGFAAAAARLIRAGAPSIELPLPGARVAQDPPPSAAPLAARPRPPRRRARRRRKRASR